MNEHDVIIIGGGQSGLACGYFLRRTDLSYIVLDDQQECGGAWLHTWESLTLFSPAEQSSLPGWLMPKTEQAFPTRKEVIDYLCQYEKRYQIPVERPAHVLNVEKDGNRFSVTTDKGTYRSRAVISATGTWSRPFIAAVPGRERFKGIQIHSAHYRTPQPFQGRKVLIVGEGNSGAQILAEVSRIAQTSWATAKPPQFLPDDVDGRVLFNVATARYYAEQKGEKFDMSAYHLGNIVMVPPVKEARDRDVLHSKGALKEIYSEGVIWEDGSREAFDAIIWCTGYHYATTHLLGIAPLGERGKIPTEGTRSRQVPGLWLVGYGQWTGFASATLIGVGRSARQTVVEIQEYLRALL